jgi:hypothetical protein
MTVIVWINGKRLQKELVMPLKNISLELARTPEFPEGNSEIGYNFIAPLNDEGFLDEEQWKAEKQKCTVLRFWKGQEDEQGLLVRLKNNVWVFDYDPTQDSDDEPIFRFDQHKFIEGEYISITEHDGVQRPFKIARVS